MAFCYSLWTGGADERSPQPHDGHIEYQLVTPRFHSGRGVSAVDQTFDTVVFAH